MSFLTDHPLLVAVGIIVLFLIWRFGIQPRLQMTNLEIEKKVTDTIDGVAETLENSIDLDQDNLMDKSSMPFYEEKKD